MSDQKLMCWALSCFCGLVMGWHQSSFCVWRHVSQISDVSHTAVKRWPLKHSVDSLGRHSIRRTSSLLVCLPSSSFWPEMACLCCLILSFSWNLQLCIDPVWLVRKAFDGYFLIDLCLWHSYLWCTAHFVSLFCQCVAIFSLDEGLGT